MSTNFASDVKSAKSKSGPPQVNEYRNQAIEGRRIFEPDWWYNLAFIAGQQYVAYSDANVLVPIDEDEEEIRPVHNFTLKIKRVEKSKLTRAHPVPQVTPTSTEVHDYATARVLEAYFLHLMHLWRWDRKFSLFTDWKVSTGTSIFKWGWDPGQENPFCDIVSPFDFYPDPYARTPQQMRWAGDSVFMSEEAAKAKYSVYKGANLDALEGSTGSRYNDLQLRLLQNYNGTTSQNLPGVIVNEFYFKPDPRIPELKNGKRIIFTQSGIVYEEAYPYNHGKLPYTMAYHIERPNSVWGDCSINYVREINREINYAEGQITYNRNLANGKYKVGAGAELEEPPNAKPGQILKLTQDSAPNADVEWMTIPAMDGAVLGEPTRLREIMHDISMLHEVSQGGVPGRVESGQAIQLLQEADDSVMAESITSSNASIADGFWLVAQLYKQFGKETTTVAVYDALGVVEHKELKKSDLGDIPDVHFYTDSGLPNSPAGKRDTVMQLWQYGIIQDPEEARELQGMRPDTQTLQLRAGHKRVADNENVLMLEKDKTKFWPVRPSPYDDHDVHIARHKQVVMEKSYREADDEGRAAIDRHIEEHYKLREDQARQDTRLKMIMEGIDPDAPAPEQPGEAGPPPPPTPPGGGTPGPVPEEEGADMGSPDELAQLPPDQGGLPPVAA
jgi:hypothetical protein